VYVPREVLRRHGVSIEQLRVAEDPARCEALMRQLIGVARSELAASMTLDEMIAADCRGVLRAMTEIYGALLSKIEADPLGSLRRAPVRVPTWRKFLIMWGAR
jgi:phytoene/squalene synthetase